MDDHILLYRQIHPKWVTDGLPETTAFKPSVKDAGRLSFYDGNAIGPDEAYRHYTDTLGFESEGIAAVTVGECEEVGILVYQSPKMNFPGHVTADFTGLSGNKVQRAARALKIKAISRGWIIRPRQST